MGRARKSSEVGVAVEAIAAEPESIRLAVKLPPKQRAALQAYRAGCSNAEAAKLAKVDLSTVSRWLTHDPKFIAAHNAVILETVKASNAEAASLLPLANAAIRKQLEKGNGWLALQFSREARSIGALDVGPTTAAAVKKELKLAQQNHENEILKKELQIQQQQQEIEKLRQQADRHKSEKQFDELGDQDFWDAFSSFKSIWDTEVREMEREQREAEEELAAAKEPPKTVAISGRPTIDEQIRQKLYSLKYERMCEVSRTLPSKEQREERLRKIRQETLSQRAKTFPNDPPPDYLRRAQPYTISTDQNKTDATKTVSQGPRAHDEQLQAQAHQSDAKRADDPRSAAVSNDAQTVPDSQRESLSENERWELEAEREMEERDEQEKREERQEREARLREAEARGTGEDRAADVKDKSNPDNPPPSPQPTVNPPEAASAKYVIDEDGEVIRVDNPVDGSG